MDKEYGLYVAHVVWLFVALFFYKILIYRTIPTCNHNESVFIWTICIVASCVLGIILTYRKGLHSADIVYNISIGLGIYSVLGYFEYLRVQIIFALLCVVVFSAIGILLVVKEKGRKWAGRKKVLGRKVCKCILIVRRNLGLAMLGILIFLTYESIFLESFLVPTVKPEVTDDSNVYFANNREILSLLHEDKWVGLTLQEKINVAQVLTNCEIAYLGIDKEIIVGVMDHSGGVCGAYYDDTEQILFDLEYIETTTAKNIINSVCHECFHAYSYQLCEVYLKLDENDRKLRVFDKASKYVAEFSDYKQSKDGLEEYIKQNCEQDAYEYATIAAGQYYQRLGIY